MKIVRPSVVVDTGSFSRASVGTYFDKNGALQTASADVQRYNYNPADLTIPPTILLEAASTNLLLNSATVVTQAITTTAQSYTLSFYGTGTVVLSGTAIGTLVGTGTNNRVSLTITASAGSITLTVTGSVVNGQFEAGLLATSRIVTTSSSVTRAADVNTSGMLSNVPETDHALWSPSTTYGINDIVMVASGGEHKNYQSLVNSNINFNPAGGANPTKWLDMGSTNRWKIFDLSVQSQTSITDFINVTIPVTSNLIDCLGLLNINGVFGRVVMTDPVEGVVFDSTFTLVSDSGITDPYAYCFEPITRLQDYFLTGLPPYLNSTLSITIAGTGETVACGVAIPGLSRTAGPTQSGLTFGIQDYSVKNKDTFGNSTILERGYNVRTSMSVWVDNNSVDFIGRLLASYRATPILYVGNDTYRATMAYGYYKDYTVGIDYTTVSVLHIELEGLT
jgi:hypothetical protein